MNLVTTNPDTPTLCGADSGHAIAVATHARWWPHGAPWLPVAIGLILGILFDERLPQRQWTYLLGLGVVAIAAAWPRVRLRAATVVVFLAAWSLGGLSHLAVARPSSPNDIGRYSAASGRIVRLQGTISSVPRLVTSSGTMFSPRNAQAGRLAFLVDSLSLEGEGAPVPVSGRVRVTLLDPRTDLHEQDRVELFGRLHPLFPPRNPGSFDWSAFHRRQGIVASLHCEHREDVRILESGNLSLIGTVISWMRVKARSLLVDDLAAGADEEADLASALVLGQRSGRDRRLNDVFIRSGCAHFLAASGTNVAILLSPLWLMATWLRLGRKRRAIFLIAAIVAYCLVAEPRPPILRATLMAVIFLASRLFARSSNHANSLCIAASFLLLIDPRTLYDLGFQLSFAAVIGVVYVAPSLVRAATAARDWADARIRHRPMAKDDRRILRRLRTRGLCRSHALWRWCYHLQNWAGWAFAVALASWISTLPITAFLFQRVQMWGPACTLFVFPLVCLATWLGIVKIVVTAASPTAGALIGALLVKTEEWLNSLVTLLADLPGASTAVPAPSLPAIQLFYAGLFLFVYRWSRRNPFTEPDEPTPPSATPSTPPAWNRRLHWLAAVFVFFSTILWLVPQKREPQVLITVLSVGRAFATVVEFPNGQALLYDAGGSAGWDVGRAAILPFLRHRNISSLRSAIISHPNVDHFSGLPSVLEEIPAETVALNAHFAPIAATHHPSRALLAWLENRGQPIARLDFTTPTWTLAGVTFELLWPPADLPSDVPSNDTSTVLRISYEGKSVLLTGDIEEFAQRKLLESVDLYADVLLLPHHGSAIATTRDFVRAVCPHAAIQSSSVRSQDSPAALTDALNGIPLYNTADIGAVQIRFDRHGILISSYLPDGRELD
ncbi:MAG: ComEC/Rec2 family competence protein [Planctomycetota bacterium]